MSLVAWYPLINSMKNQGIGDNELTVSYTPSFGTGLLGGSLINGGGSYLTATQCSKIFNNEAMSICYWVYVDSEAGSTSKRAMFFGNDGASSARLFSVFQYPTCNDLHLSWYNGSSIYATVDSGVLPSYKWTHVAICYKKGGGAIYINGSKIRDLAVTMNNATSAYAVATNIIYTCQYRKLNDFRVYDHCLSAREAKEISKGLVAHYHLDENGKGNDNLVPNCSQYNSLNTALTRTSASTDGWYWVPGTHFIVEPSTTYTFSVCCDGTLASGHGASADPSVKSFTMWLYLCNSNTTKDYNNGGYDSPINFNSSNYNHQQIGNKHIWQYTTSSNQTHMSVRVNTYSNGTNATTVKFWQIKVEKGSVATPWCPNSNDSAYTTLGYNSNLEIDTSGYGYHGTKTKSMNVSSNTAKYSSSTIFDGDNDCILVPFNSMIKDTNYTISVWCYKSELGTDGYQTIFGGPSGFELEARNGTANEAKFITWNWGKVAYAYNFNEWYHVCFVHTSSDSKLYVNGNLIGTGTSASIPSGNYYIGSWRDTTSQNFQGNMSDFRIYATALSADDVKELYQNSASISNNGTIHCFEIEEI